jgi:hypothetical protein
MNRVVVDVMTGERQLVPLTQDEINAISAAANAPPPVPQVVSMRQARRALLSSGLLAQVDAAVAAIPGAEGEVARIEWEYSGTVERSWPLVLSIGTSLGITDEQMDDLFLLAATL